MLYGIFNDEASGGTVGDLGSACGVTLRTGTHPWNGQGGKDMVAAAGREETP